MARSNSPRITQELGEGCGKQGSARNGNQCRRDDAAQLGFSVADGFGQLQPDQRGDSDGGSTRAERA